jgi:hypothetical protein
MNSRVHSCTTLPHSRGERNGSLPLTLFRRVPALNTCGLTILQCQLMSMLCFRALRYYEYAIRIDEDVCLAKLPEHVISEALSAFGLVTFDGHTETRDTFWTMGEWVHAGHRVSANDTATSDKQHLLHRPGLG